MPQRLRTSGIFMEDSQQTPPAQLTTTSPTFLANSFAGIALEACRAEYKRDAVWQRRKRRGVTFQRTGGLRLAGQRAQRQAAVLFSRAPTRASRLHAGQTGTGRAGSSVCGVKFGFQAAWTTSGGSAIDLADSHMDYCHSRSWCATLNRTEPDACIIDAISGFPGSVVRCAHLETPLEVSELHRRSAYQWGGDIL